jgi:predicted nucleic acid-binding protein
VILVDTSIWIDHFRSTDAILVERLNSGQVLTHPFVIGELALGQLRRREAILAEITKLPAAHLAHDDEVLRFVERHSLFGQGIGYVDAHLLASVRLTAGAGLWTRDARLDKAARNLGIAAKI